MSTLTRFLHLLHGHQWVAETPKRLFSTDIWFVGLHCTVCGERSSQLVDDREHHR